MVRLRHLNLYNSVKQSSQIKKSAELLQRYPLVHLLSKELHQALQVRVITEDVVLSQHCLETSGRYVSFLFQVDKFEVIC